MAIPTPFSRTLRCLENDGLRPYLWLATMAFGMTVAWSGWFFFGSLPQIETSLSARIESELHQVDTEVEGRITKNELRVGREVEAGEVLVELDVSPIVLSLAEEKSKLAALEMKLGPLKAELERLRDVTERVKALSAVKFKESTAEAGAARAAASFAQKQHTRVKQLQDNGFASREELERATTDAQQLRSNAAMLIYKRLRTTAERDELIARDLQSMERLRKEIAETDGSIETQRHSIEKLETLISKSQIKAPVKGVISDVAIEETGRYVFAGTRLATVVEGDYRIIASFSPPSAIGRIRAGQTATMRLLSFPWVQYGTVTATVVGIGAEIRDERVRVELAIDHRQPTSIPLQHGLIGDVEVEVERLAPATLVLRALGEKTAATPVAPGAKR